MFVVKRFSVQDQSLAEHAFAIRNEVFVQEQGIAAALEYDREAEAHHYLLFLGDQALATARWRATEKGIKLERFAVRQPFRNKGIGAILLKEILPDVSALGIMIYLHAQLRSVTFYERNGFSKVGNQFSEAGIAHFMMQYPATAKCGEAVACLKDKSPAS